MKTKEIVVCILGCWLIQTTEADDFTSPLARQAHQRYENGMKVLVQSYVAELKIALQNITSTGNLEEANRIKAEIERMSMLLAPAIDSVSSDQKWKDLQRHLIETRWIYFFDGNRRKEITFLPTGKLGEGRNANENSWRMNGTRLDILTTAGQVLTRFEYDAQSKRWATKDTSGCREKNQRSLAPKE